MASTADSGQPKPRALKTIDWDGNEYNVTLDQLRWRPSAYAIIIQDGKLLVSRQYGAYTIPGGGIELGELPEDALIREVREETGLHIGNPRLVACRSNYFTLPTSKKGKHIQSILLFYRCDIVGGEPSTEFMTTEERDGGGEPPEWISLELLDSLPAKGSLDWKALIKELLSPPAGTGVRQ